MITFHEWAERQDENFLKWAGPAAVSLASMFPAAHGQTKYPGFEDKSEYEQQIDFLKKGELEDLVTSGKGKLDAVVAARKFEYEVVPTLKLGLHSIEERRLTNNVQRAAAAGLISAGQVAKLGSILQQRPELVRALTVKMSDQELRAAFTGK